MPQPWLVLDMDEGVIRREPTRRAAVAWITEHHDAQVVSRRRYRAGDYEYHIGNPGDEESGVCYFVQRLDMAVLDGWDHWFEIPDLYPFPRQPHFADCDVDRDALIRAKERRERGRS